MNAEDLDLQDGQKVSNDGLPARSRGRFIKREVIGPAECPILIRWTLLNFGRGTGKLMLHRFLPNADDRAVHDHPWPFVTFVLRGYYDDWNMCERCLGTGEGEALDVRRFPCGACGGSGIQHGERMKPLTLRYRPAEHVHRTRAGPDGCWTLIWAGPVERRWGFWRRGVWWPWEAFERRFGPGMRCDE